MMEFLYMASTPILHKYICIIIVTSVIRYLIYGISLHISAIQIKDFSMGKLNTLNLKCIFIFLDSVLKRLPN